MNLAIIICIKFFQIQLRPGEEKTFRITGLDQFNNPTYFVARVIDENESLRATLSSLFTITDTFDPPADYNELYMDKVIQLCVCTCTTIVHGALSRI